MGKKKKKKDCLTFSVVYWACKYSSVWEVSSLACYLTTDLYSGLGLNLTQVHV